MTEVNAVSQRYGSSGSWIGEQWNFAICHTNIRVLAEEWTKRQSTVLIVFVCKRNSGRSLRNSIGKRIAPKNGCTFFGFLNNKSSVIIESFTLTVIQFEITENTDTLSPNTGHRIHIPVWQGKTDSTINKGQSGGNRGSGHAVIGNSLGADTRRRRCQISRTDGVFVRSKDFYWCGESRMETGNCQFDVFSRLIDGCVCDYAITICGRHNQPGSYSVSTDNFILIEKIIVGSWSCSNGIRPNKTDVVCWDSRKIKFVAAKRKCSTRQSVSCCPRCKCIWVSPQS